MLENLFFSSERMILEDQKFWEKYQLRQKLGQNGSRQTWLAQDLRSEVSQLVVVKILAFGNVVQWEDLKLFEREAQILQQLNHPHIPKYQDYFSVDESTLWFGLVQEYIPGISLENLLNGRTKFSEGQICQIAQEILQILIYLHELNPPVLHRDIKPSNLIWGKDQKIYLIDFSAVQNKAVSQGATFTVVGTYGYTPMEQFGGRAIPASDLYALGATLIHLMTGIAPADLPMIDLRIQFRDFVGLAETSESKNNLVSWIEKLAEPIPEKRFQTARQALEALQEGLLSNYTKKNFRKPCSLTKLAHTDVKINKTSQKLEIIIPRRKVKLTDLVIAIFILLIVLLLLITKFHLTVLILISLSISFGLFPHIKRLLFKTQIKFDCKYFEINKFFLGTTYFQQGITNEIQDISINYSLSSKSIILKTKACLLNSSIKKITQYSFGHGLSEKERIWIVQEIRDWLA